MSMEEIIKKETKRGDRVKNLLKETSYYVHHGSNMAKEYILMEDGEWLTIGQNCININRNLYKTIEEDGNTKFEHIKDKYVLCYGISLTNIISIMIKKKVEVLSIVRYDEDDYYKYYVITVLARNSRPTAYKFNETHSLEDFESTELGDFVCTLYNF